MRIGLLNLFKSLQSTNLKTMKEGTVTLLVDDGNTLTNKPMVPMVHFQSTKQMAAFPMDKNDYPPLLHHQASHPSFTHESSHCACFKRREMTFSHPCAASKKGTSTLVPQVDIIFVLERLVDWMRCLELCQFPEKKSAGLLSRILMDTIVNLSLSTISYRHLPVTRSKNPWMVPELRSDGCEIRKWSQNAPMKLWGEYRLQGGSTKIPSAKVCSMMIWLRERLELCHKCLIMKFCEYFGYWNSQIGISNYHCILNTTVWNFFQSSNVQLNMARGQHLDALTSDSHLLLLWHWWHHFP